MRHPDSGTKVILEYDGRILACLRDDDPAIPFPNTWDLPGGGAEKYESLLACGEREVSEEFGISVALTMIEEIESRYTRDKILGRAYGRLTAAQVGRIVFSEEGQCYDFFTPAEIAHLDFVPELQEYVLAMYGVANSVRPLEQTA